MPASADTNITLTWNGQTWTVSPSPGLRFKRGATITVPIPADVLEPEAPRQRATDAERKLLFPAGTVLYLPIVPVRDELAFRQIAAARRPVLRVSSNGDQLPIILEEDLYIRTVSESLAPCRCSYAGPDSRRFKSLNDAAKTAKTRWTNSISGAVCVFEAVSFIHDERLIRLDFQRQNVLHGTPLPDNPQPDLGPPLDGLDLQNANQ